MTQSAASPESTGHQVELPEAPLPDGSLRLAEPKRSDRLADASVSELATELLYRLQEGEGLGTSDTETWLGQRLLHALDKNIDVHNNRFSRNRYSDLFGTFHTWVTPEKPPIRDATYVELGCGSLNPFGTLFLFLMLGARRGVGVDLDAIQDEKAALVALADLAALMLIDPHRIVADYPITRKAILDNIASFNLAKLKSGDQDGIDRDRLSFKQETVHSLSLEDSEADVVYSNSFLEHVSRAEAAVAELSRITKPGGMGIHGIDMSDHRRYGDPSHPPLAFLQEDSQEELVSHSNRVRLPDFVRMFERQGFFVLETIVSLRAEMSVEMRSTFVEPFRSMELADLEAAGAVIVARKR